MKTKWLASREFSAHPGRALAAVGRAGRVLVTAIGKPKAIMIPTSEATFSRDLEMLDRVALTHAAEAIRSDSVVNSTAALAMDEISVLTPAQAAAELAQERHPSSLKPRLRSRLKQLARRGRTECSVSQRSPPRSPPSRSSASGSAVPTRIRRRH
jgi:hypothetical protein